MFLLTTPRYVCREIYLFVACRNTPKYRQSGPDVRVRVISDSAETSLEWSRRTSTRDVEKYLGKVSD